MWKSITGIPARADHRGGPDVRRGAETASILYCMGITQHTTGTDNVKSLANLAMLCGQPGHRGRRRESARGQNNVQGACDMGGLAQCLHRLPARWTIRPPAGAWKRPGAFPVFRTRPGLTVTEMIPRAHDGRLKALYMVGENPLVSDPDLNHAAESLDQLDFLVVQDIFLTETARAGRCGAAVGLLCRKGRHLHQHGATGPTGPQSRRRRRARPGKTGPSSAIWPAGWDIPWSMIPAGPSWRKSAG